ncbi:hypothetical protein FRB91_003758 [Serendipita sp. 411]|nr:hypothetical protein FRB91_003758 [Serendipita sp. 411]
MATSPEHHKESFTRRALKLHKPVLSLDRNTSGSPKHAAHPSVFARFQAHFLPHSSSPPAAATTVTPGNVGPPPEIPEPDYVKIRIVTWNMNETLPKGDLAPLLGEVPAYQKNSNEKPDLKIPDLSLADDHPYHFVLIAGQECPTLMGLPLGLGGGLKWDRDEDEKKKDHKDKDEGKKRTDIVVEKVNISRPDLPSGSRTPSRYHHTTHHAVGWTSILEDYFSRGIGSIRGVKPDIFSPSTNPSAASLLASPDRPKPTNSPAGALVPGMANKGAKWKLPPGETDIPKIGPYELLTKERVMGIYLALYVHRDVQSLVEDYSQSSVTAGLMGGRLGNKGAVAISLKFAGTTFLFMNAHLAAHEEKVALRISNMHKIKSELVINDFLPPTDSRKLAEDPTDRFDHTFLCGDLNFRLDITRQHAEWLVNKQKDYAQAQHFDQLRKIMQGKGTNVFSGFSEAHIDFPPTFKYDILRTLKDRKKARREAKLKQRGLSEVREQDKEGSSTPSSTRIGETNDQDSDSSSTESSSLRLKGMREDGDSDSSSCEDAANHDKEWDASLAHLERKASSIKHAAKKKWYRLFKSTTSLPASSPISVTSKDASASVDLINGNAATVPSRRSTAMTAGSTGDNGSKQSRAATLKKSERSGTVMAPPLSPRAATSMDIPRRPDAGLALASSSLMRSVSTKSAVALTSSPGNDESLDVEDRGVYDTSSKQRVPSWCDRVLFKTTVPIPPSPIAEEAPTVLVQTSQPPPTSPSRQNTPKVSFFGAFKRRKGSTATRDTTESTLQPGLGLESKDASPVVQRKTKSQTSQHSEPQKDLVVDTEIARHQDSPIALSKSSTPSTAGFPAPLSGDSTKSGISERRTTSPSIGRTTPLTGGIGSLKLYGKRGSSLSATLPRSTVAAEALAQGLPVSTSSPPASNLEGSAPHKPGESRPPVPALRRILSLFSDSFSMASSPPPVATPEPVLPVYGPAPKIYKRGEVRCLSYSTLSDREMRRLEARSDHRPVIGRFAVYI